MEFLNCLIIPLAIVLGSLYMIVRRALQMKRLAADPVDTMATVTRKLSYGGSNRTRYAIRYEYSDANGRTHTHKSVVSRAEWEEVEEGRAIPVSYSQSHPSISAPREMVRQAQEALKK